ncbi:MAG: crotonase/enoyl-CoA hydratase family protein [Bacteroidota bacterium]
MDYQHFIIQKDGGVSHVMINRPNKANSLDTTSWHELKAIFESLKADPETRAIVLSGEGKHFCAGIDVSLLVGMNMEGAQHSCDGRRGEWVRETVAHLQVCVNTIEECKKPVMAAIHGGCIGAGLDIAAACDMRYCTESTAFSIKEIDMGLVADLGSIQRLPHILPDGIIRELAYTGRKFLAGEALTHGLVNAVYKDKEEMMDAVMSVAGQIAEKSPLCIRGIKDNILYARDHTVADGLNYIQVWNAAMLLSDDLKKAGEAYMMKQKPEFAN